MTSAGLNHASSQDPAEVALGAATGPSAQGAALAPAQRDEKAAALLLGDIAVIERALRNDVDPAAAQFAISAFHCAEDAALRNDKMVRTGGGDDRLVAVSRVLAVEAEAVGIKNVGLIAAAAGKDLLAGAGIAIGDDNAVAYGVLNESVVEMGGDADRVIGAASATGPLGSGPAGSATAFGYSEIDPAGDRASRLSAGAGADSIIGIATAVGAEDVGAFGLVFQNADTGDGADLVQGWAKAEGRGSTEARSISIGVSDVDDDALEPPQSGAAVGVLRMGRGDDVLKAETILTVTAGADDQVFFAGANGVVVDGGIEAQWREIVTANATVLAQAAAAQAAGDRFAVTRAVQPLLAQMQTSTLDTGGGDDAIISSVVMRVNSAGFAVDPDDDLEVIADAIENGGRISLGAGDDRLEISNDVRSGIDGAKAFADAHDNASIGLLSGYSAIATQVLTELGLIGAGSANPQVRNVEVEVTNSAVFDLGDGDDTVVTRTFASALDDIPSADGLSNRGLWVGGDGSENLDLNNVSVFVLGEVLNGGDDGEQREGISDGWESRNLIFMDDIIVLADGRVVEGSSVGDGADVVKTDATAFGNGVLTISDGFEGREYTNTGGGGDTFDVTGRAFTTARGASDTAGILAQNITAATGLQTEQVDEGDFLMRGGNDRLIGRALAAPALGLDPFAFDPAAFTPGSFDPTSDLFANRSTIAQGISQVTADVAAVNDGSRDRGIIDTGGIGGPDNDVLDGAATAFGVADVQAYGMLLTQAVTGRGADALTGQAEATGRNVAFANGVAVGISANADNDGRTLRPEQIGTLSTGTEADVLTAFASATTFTDGARRIADGLGDGSVVVSEANADANGVLIDLGSTLDLGAGRNRMTATAEAADRGIGGVNAAVTADGVENRGLLSAGSGADAITGAASARSQGGVLLTLAGGIDNGFGSTRNDIQVAPIIATGGGADRIEGVGAVTSLGGIGLASGIESSGLIDAGAGDDRLSGTSTVMVTDGINAVADGIENADIAGLGGGVIATGGGADTLFARAVATGINTRAEAIAIRNDFVDLVNDGPDTVIARGRIDLGANADVIDAFAEATSSLGLATAIGIRGGRIDAGAGNDRIVAASNELLVGDDGVALTGGRGFGGDVEIDMGSGNDVLSGFGQATAKGGSGTDTLVFAFSRAEFDLGGGVIVLGDPASRSVDFTFGGETLSTDGFERFSFAAEPFPVAYDALLMV